jgi:hypothetical protein
MRKQADCCRPSKRPAVILSRWSAVILEPAKRGEDPHPQARSSQVAIVAVYAAQDDRWRGWRDSLAFLASAPSRVDDPQLPGRKATTAIRNATIVPVSGPTIANGSVVFANGVITAIGTNAAIPSDATVIDGTGLFVYPGMIDSGSSVGLIEIDSVAGTVDTSELGDFNPNAQAAVAINPHSELVPVTRVSGVTHVLSVPEGGVISGQSALVQLIGWTPQEMLVKAPAAMHIRFPRLRSTSPFSQQPPDEEAEKEQKKAYEVSRSAPRHTSRRETREGRGARANGARRFDRDLMLKALVPVVRRVRWSCTRSCARHQAALAFADSSN